MPGMSYFRRCLSGMGSCAKSSTAHGVNHVANSGHPIIRAFWLVAFAAGSLIFLFHFYTLLSRYFSNPVSIVVKYRVVDFQFPDVTFCPVLPFSVRVLEAKKKLKQLENIKDPKSKEMEDLMLEGRIPVDNFVLDCTYYERPCNLTRDFKLVEDPRYRPCYTFSPNNRRALSTGPQHALQVVLFAESKHPHTVNQKLGFPIPPEWQTAGIRVVVHPPGTHPHPEIRGINVAPRTSSLISLGVSRVTQIKDCLQRQEVSVCDAHDRSAVITFNFTKEDCYSEQIQEIISAECGCVSDSFELPYKFCNTSQVADDMKLPICRLSVDLKHCHENVVYEINQNFNEDVISKCPYLCSEMHWNDALYTTAWPSQFAEDEVSMLFEQAHKRLIKENKTSYLSEYARERHGENVQTLIQNLAHIAVYPNSLTGNEELQEDAYPLMSLLGEVGGILGLWLGCSVLTFFEPVELLLHTVTPCCMRQVNKLRRKKRLPPPTSNDRTAFQALSLKNDETTKAMDIHHIPPETQKLENTRQLPKDGFSELTMSTASSRAGLLPKSDNHQSNNCTSFPASTKSMHENRTCAPLDTSIPMHHSSDNGDTDKVSPATA